MTPTRIAIIGAGWWSTYAHIPGVLANPDAELVGVADLDAHKLAAAASAYDLTNTYADYRAMIEEQRPEGVIIATSHATHAAIAAHCLQQGIAVLVEKPMTLYATDARDLVALAAAHNCALLVGYTHNFAPSTRQARAVIAEGTLGAVQYINAMMVSHVIELYAGAKPPMADRGMFPVHGPGAVYSNPALSGGGQGHLQLTHLAGLLCYVTDLRAQRVQALMHKHGLPVDLVDAMTIALDGGALATFGGSGNAHGGRFELQVHCERGSLALDVLKGTLEVHGEDGPLAAPPLPPTEADTPEIWATGRNLVDVIRGRAANGAPGEIGWRAVEILDAAYRSAAQDGTPVTVASLYE